MSNAEKSNPRRTSAWPMLCIFIGLAMVAVFAGGVLLSILFTVGSGVWDASFVSDAIGALGFFGVVGLVLSYVGYIFMPGEKQKGRRDAEH